MIPSPPHIHVGINPFHPQRVNFSHRSYYTVALILEEGRLYFADKWVDIDRPALVFASPLKPYAWEAVSNKGGSGYHCLFNEAFLGQEGNTPPLPDNFAGSIIKEPVLFLDYDQLQTFKSLFQKMWEEYQSDYPQKNELLRGYLHLLAREVSKLNLKNGVQTHHSAAQRIVELFLNILDSQFPIKGEMTNSPLTTPAQYADLLAVHVNHLNRVVKQLTGKTTTEVIASRLTDKAVKLLSETDKSIGEIAQTLGFEEPASFSRYLRKHTGKSPKELRRRHTLFDLDN